MTAERDFGIDRRSRGRGLLLALVVVSLAACAPETGFGDPTPHEALPAGGSIHLTSDPPTAPRALSLRYLYRGDPSGVSDEFIAGAVVVVDRSLLPEPHRLQVNGQRCEGEFSIASDVETDLVLFLSDAGCVVETAGSHPEGALQHGNEAAALFGAAPLGSRLTVRPISGVVTPVTVLAADESGSFHIDSLPAGRYAVTVIVGDRIRSTIEIELQPGEERYLDLSGTLSSVAPTP